MTLDKSALSELSQSSSWKKLLHYHKTELGQEKSQVANSQFFISTNGAKNSEHELTLNISAYHHDESYSCKFPARAVWISKNLKLPSKLCSEVENWKQKIQAETVAIVHVSQFVSNPSSAFGHSFLLFQNSSRPLNMHMAINNAAEMPETVTAWQYVTKGLLGGFPGTYSIEPFYLKIQEYNHIENRDMWIYELNLASNEIDQLLNHIWELTEHGTDAYYFLNRNCSVNIYNAIAAIQDKLDFFSENQIYVAPVESVQKIQQLIVKRTYLPSMRERIVQRKRHLKESRNPVLEEAEIQLDLFEYKKSQNEGQLSKADAEAYSQQLVTRSRLGPNADKVEFKSPPSPEGASKTWRLATGWDKEDNSNRIQYSLAGLYHSIVQNETGYLPNSEIIVLKIDFLQEEKNSFLLDDSTLIKLTNFPVSTDFDSQTSFRFQAGVGRETGCSRCYFPKGEFAIGKSISLGRTNVAYGMIGAVKDQSQILMPELVIGTAFHFEELNLNFEHRSIQDVSKGRIFERIWEAQVGWTYSRNRDLQISGQRQNNRSNYSAILGFYF